MARSNKLFKDLNVRNSVSRNGFDLSNEHYFTAKVGEIIPLWHRTAMPGDKARFRINSFTRTRSVQTAAFTKIYEYFDYFFVPYRLLGKQIPHILSQDVDNPVVATSQTGNQSVTTYLPRIQLDRLRGSSSTSLPKLLGTKTNEFGFYRAVLTNKLLNHLGYFWQSTKGAKDNAGIVDEEGDALTPKVEYSVNPYVSLLPLAAYQKICYDFFRNTQWEDNVPYNYNFDYLSSTSIYSLPGSTTASFWNNRTMFDLQYANYPKDLFFGLLPDSQYGDTAVVEAEGFSANTLLPVQDSDGVNIAVGNADGTGQNNITTINNTNPTGELFASASQLVSTLRTRFDILEFRKARFAQHYKEIVGTGKKNMKSLISKIYGVEIPDTLTDECYYLGGHSNVISISEVDNTNLVDTNSAIQRGKGVGSSNGDLIEYDVKEYGIIMCVYHAMPKIDFALNNAHFDILKTSVDDYANPIFDNLGLQEFNALFLDNTKSNNISQTPFIGWTNRYFDYKTSIDQVNGDFRETLYTWVAPLTPQYLFEYDGTNETRPGIVVDYRFFKINPKILNSIFDIEANSYINTDQLRCKVEFSVNMVRPLSYLGIPNN